jgi:hypothetical protein
MHISPYIFESIMLICFGSAWPFSIYKSYKSRVNNGKSIIFLLIILVGYLNGIIYQSMIVPVNNTVLALFFINFTLVSIDLAVYVRNIFIARSRFM